MTLTCSTRLSKLLISSLLLPTLAFADDPLGIYMGGGVGPARSPGTIVSPIAAPAAEFSGGTTGWEAVLGMHPLPGIGAEASYFDFGSATSNVGSFSVLGGFIGTATAHPRAAALFAVGYLPIPVPQLDVFLKAGAAELRTEAHANLTYSCVALTCQFPPYDGTSNSTRFAYGAGAQYRIPGTAVAAGVEYQRISAPAGDPSLLLLRLVYGF